MAEISPWEQLWDSLGALCSCCSSRESTIDMWLCWTSTCYKQAALAQITAPWMWQSKWIYHSELDCCSRFEECAWLGRAGGAAETGSKWCLVSCRFCRVGGSADTKGSITFLFFYPAFPAGAQRQCSAASLVALLFVRDHVGHEIFNADGEVPLHKSFTNSLFLK